MASHLSQLVDEGGSNILFRSLTDRRTPRDKVDKISSREALPKVKKVA